MKDREAAKRAASADFFQKKTDKQTRNAITGQKDTIDESGKGCKRRKVQQAGREARFKQANWAEGDQKKKKKKDDRNTLQRRLDATKRAEEKMLGRLECPACINCSIMLLDGDVGQLKEEERAKNWKEDEKSRRCARR